MKLYILLYYDFYQKINFYLLGSFCIKIKNNYHICYLTHSSGVMIMAIWGCKKMPYL